MTQKEIIKRVLGQHNDWLPGWSFIRVQTEWGWLPERANRTLREMAHDNLIEKKYIDGEVWYKTRNKPSKLIQELNEMIRVDKLKKEGLPKLSRQELRLSI
jgi:hypothetical protein